MCACRLVQQHGVGCWSKLLPEFQGRIGKQLRERWNHELRPDINKEGWSHEEELELVKAHRTVGNCWADIAKVKRVLPASASFACVMHTMMIQVPVLLALCALRC